MMPLRRGVGLALGLLLIAAASAGYGLYHQTFFATGPVIASQAPPLHTDLYTCPMHPQIVSDRPANCPICGMDLVKKPSAVAAPQAASSSGTDGVGEVTLSPRQRVLANIATRPVSRRVLVRAIDAVGQVTTDASRLRRVSAWVDGRIERLYVTATGATIRPGMVLATIYSPELVAAQQEYLIAASGDREMKQAAYPELSRGAQDLLAAARQRLILLGVTPAQITQLAANRTPQTAFPVMAPTGGVVLERKVQPGQYVKSGDVLFDLADFSRVWLEVQVFEPDLAEVRVGQPAEVTVTALPGRTLHGRVAVVLPALDLATRTATLRIELPNPTGRLRPGMFASARLSAAAGAGLQLAVPASAVLATGRAHLVYVESAPNRFVPRHVRVGAKAGEWYPVYQGLQVGEHVAVSGGFLLDASAQLSGN